jgi:uncharacterized protein (DUF1330 family)
MVAFALLAGVVLGAMAVEGLHAQTKPPAYVIAEIDVLDQEGYTREYQPAAIKAINPKFLSRGSKTISFRGEPPKRIVVFAFDDLDKAQVAFTSEAYNNAYAIGSKYATSRIFAVEGVAQLLDPVTVGRLGRYVR